MSRVVYHYETVTRVTKVSAANRWKFRTDPSIIVPIVVMSHCIESHVGN